MNGPSYSVRSLNGGDELEALPPHTHTLSHRPTRYGLYYGNQLMAIIDPGWERQVKHMLLEREGYMQVAEMDASTRRVEFKVEDEEWHRLRSMEG